MTGNLYLGQSGLGSSQYGYGSPASINSTTAKLFRKVDGTYGNVAKTNPNTGDYVLDANGNNVGDDSVNQMVFLALRTIKNSSSVANFGFDFKAKVISDSAELKIKLAVNDTLKNLITKKLIILNSVEVNRATVSGLEITVKWTNTSSSEQNTFKF